MPNPIYLVIFDLDDTLIRSQIDYNKLRHKLSVLFPNKPSPSELAYKPILSLLKQLSKLHSENYIKAKKIVERTERDAVLNAQIMEGASDVPHILAQYNVQGAIYTNNSSENVKLYLERPGFDFLNQFLILTRNDVREPKPNPEGILKILSQFNNVSKENTIFIGDSPLDAQAALKAGIRWVLYDSRNLNRDVFPPDPFGIISHWSELETLLRS
ncbi:HAD-IA family hydrolase [Candidatus Pacearchaeota archaeon]|nr:HAD-IA family hydrolase [Candidatus Pacearchaeota archaeon]